MKEIDYLKKINNERIIVNSKLSKTLKELINRGENLDNYELWVNHKCNLFIKPNFSIKQYSKDLEKEGFPEDYVYVIVKK